MAKNLDQIMGKLTASRQAEIKKLAADIATLKNVQAVSLSLRGRASVGELSRESVLANSQDTD